MLISNAPVRFGSQSEKENIRLEKIKSELRRLANEVLFAYEPEKRAQVRMTFKYTEPDSLVMDLHHLPTVLAVGDLCNAIRQSPGYDAETGTFQGYNLHVFGNSGAPAHPTLVVTVSPKDTIH